MQVLKTCQNVENERLLGSKAKMGHIYQTSPSELREYFGRDSRKDGGPGYRELCCEMISSELGMAAALRLTTLMVTSA